jgi:uncharacterized membrane protein YccF (DUF307 family)
MRLLLNLLWVVLGGGWLIFLEYALAGALLCVTVVGIPFGLQCFKIALLGVFPFGRDLRSTQAGMFGQGVGLLLNVVWLVLAGLWIFLSHLALAVGLAVTLIGIPFAYQHLKLALLALAPFGQRLD